MSKRYWMSIIFNTICAFAFGTYAYNKHGLAYMLFILACNWAGHLVGMYLAELEKRGHDAK